MNNKGQTLVVFVILLPLMIMLLSFVANEGFVYIHKRRATNEIKNAIEYRFKIKDNNAIYNKVEKYITKNLKHIDNLNIEIDNNYIKVSVILNIPNLVPSIIFEESYKINLEFEGYKVNDEIRIEG